MRNLNWTWALILGSTGGLLAQSHNPADHFESRVRPLLLSKCYGCHTSAKSGGLRLDSRQSVLQGGQSGPAASPGKPDESLLIQAVRRTHERLKMPPPGQLPPEEIAALEQWVKDGLPWPESPAELFDARVRTVLETKCLACHASAPQGGLRMDSRENLLKGGGSGPAIVPGDPGNSLLIQSVRHTHARLKMPPTGKLTDREIDDLAAWVKAGAQWSSSTASGGEYRISDLQRAFWSFQPIKKGVPPLVKRKIWPRGAIDRFILARLEEKKLTPAATADRLTLIRRASFDLTGLPPPPEEVETFLNDKSPNAFAKVIERLLASPHYGERWGRHWLDLVRYADSAGDSSDYPIPQAYRYRDYVIESFNRDKPYDRFLREQIAGDLIDARSEEERWEGVVATGYLAISRRFSVRPERNMHLTIEDTVDNLGKSVLGLTIACARCHDHKYDPISAKDYYALYGIFDSTRFPFAGSENDQFQKDLVLRIPKEKADEILKPWLDQLKPIDVQLKKLEEERKVVSRGLNTDGRKIEQVLAEVKALKETRAPIWQSMPLLDMAYATAEGEPHNARVQKRGDPDNLGDEVPRRFPQILGGQTLPPGAKGSGRLQLAEWIADPKNPLTARVMVNRIWQRHFGRGLVATPNDFGKRGTTPSHPELLDYLAVRFIESGWSIKAMHREIMLSHAYQQSSEGNYRYAEIDPGNDLLWKFNRRRLDAESIRDTLLLISGALDRARGGAHPFPHEATWAFTQHKPFNAVYETERRSVYLMTQRIQRHPYLAIFDGADPNASTAERSATITPIQALFMMNSEFVHRQAERLASRLVESAADARGRIERAHRIALGRPPAVEELRKAEDYLLRARTKLSGVPEKEQPKLALASYVRALVSSNEFLFVD